MLSLLPTPENRERLETLLVGGVANDRQFGTVSPATRIIEAAAAVMGAAPEVINHTIEVESGQNAALSEADRDLTPNQHPDVSQIVQKAVFGDFGSEEHRARVSANAKKLAQPADIRDRLLAPTDMELKDAA
jgi:hypothetical protein